MKKILFSRLFVFLTMTTFLMGGLLNELVAQQCILAGSYNNTADFQTAIDNEANAPNNCTTITLSGSAQWSQIITIPSTATLVISGTGTITGNGAINSTNNIVIATGGVFVTNNNSVTIDGMTFNNLATVNGPVTITSSGLPVELSNISASLRDNLVFLKWSTYSELNNEKFLIERSADSRSFQVIGEVAGAGTSQEKQEYQFTDRSPLPGINYYRLRQVDFDGQFENSPVRSVTVRKDSEVAVYPTVTRDFVQVVLPEKTQEQAEISVFNTQGALLFRQVYSPNGTLSVDLSGFNAGSYLLEVKTGREVMRSRVFRL